MTALYIAIGIVIGVVLTNIALFFFIVYLDNQDRNHE